MTDTMPVEDTSKYVLEMRGWLNCQPHLPKDNIDDNLLLRFVHSCYYDVEKAKSAMDSFFNIRLSCPELLDGRDPESPEFQKVMSILNIGQIQTPQNECLWIWQLNDPGLDNYDYIQDARYFMLSTDAYFMSNTFLPEVDIVILDAKDLNLKMLTKLNLSVARKLSKYQETALPIRLKQVHVINAPSSIDTIFGLLKPFLKKELTDLVHFHTPKSNGLYKYVEKVNLPTDYGGVQPSMAEQHQKVISVIMSKRKELMIQNLWRALPTDKKKVNNSSSSISSFRSLAID
ncbi:unnamed protein product [Pieris macdunnoughi]|uniref:CRAL-TRIO domain-containing protein n=1 Tax=Pieris macdunnoughi TaxID=345717 RepID=A0A821QK50_9NEOP|nr:unnamed protein product [Pieris macdunnoughi]